MKRLEDIEKKQYFEVPDGYFENLPLKIQERVARPQARLQWFQAPALRYAVPVAIIAVAGWLWLKPNAASIEDQLSDIHESELITYLNESEVVSEDLEDEVSWRDEDINDLEERVLNSFDANDDALKDLIEEYRIEADNF
jgi:hypothetical protein